MRKSPRKKASKETEISNLPNKEFKEMDIRTLTKPECRIEELQDNFNKEKV